MENLSLNEYIEITSVLANLIYIILLFKEKITAWIFGIIGSLLGAYLFFTTQLYSESILYLFYVVMGVYGWMNWHKKAQSNQPFNVSVFHLKKHLQFIAIGIVLALGLGTTFSSFTDAQSPYLDGTTTAFSFVATYLETQKELASWIYWIVINAVTVYLYTSKGLDIYGYLMILYTITSFIGLYSWNKSYQASKMA